MLTAREKFVWDVVLMDAQTSQPEEYVFESYWSPNRDFITSESVAIAAAAEAGYLAGKIAKVPVSAVLREAAEVVEIHA